MAQLQEYKCPCCGGAIEFNSGLQKMKCPYCDTEFEMEVLESFDQVLQEDAPDEMQWEERNVSEWEEGETDSLRNYICQSCGGEIIGDESMAATSCPYCGNPVVVMGQFKGDLKPDMVIPFKLDKKAAKEALKNHLKGKRLLPKVFKDENHIDEIKGIYVPFWLYDAEANAHARYRATRVRTWSDPQYIHTETQFFSVIRGGKIEFEGVPVDGSTKMADDLMESIEPYDYKDAVDFQTAYLAGYLADKYDVTAEESVTRANERIKSSTEKKLADTVQGFATVVQENCNIQLSHGEAKYALCPVWILNTSWKGENYTFAMNGQTGKFVGNLPCDNAVARKWLFGLTAAIGGALSVLAYLFWLF